MADALRYLASTAEAAELQPEPLGSVTSAKLAVACPMAEDETDNYLGTKSIAIPITINGLLKTQQDEFKRAVAKMVEYVIYSQHGPRAAAVKAKTEAETMLDEFISHADLEHTSVQRRLGIANYQEEFIGNWNDPNQTAENMDE